MVKDKETSKSVLKKTAEFVSSTTTIIVGSVAAVSFLISIFGEPIIQSARRTLGVTSTTAASSCVYIPNDNRHKIDSAPPGGLATVTWRDVRRIRECEKPSLTAVIVNGDGLYHDVELTTNGVSLPVGVHDKVVYGFIVPESASPGEAWFRIELDFHEDSRSIRSPKIDFTILEPEGDLNDKENPS